MLVKPVPESVHFSHDDRNEPLPDPEVAAMFRPARLFQLICLGLLMSSPGLAQDLTSDEVLANVRSSANSV